MAVLAVVVLATTPPAFANPTDADPFGVGPYRPCEETVRMSLSEAVVSLNELDGRIRPDLGSKELMFLMGNQHRFQDQWLIISLIYPPKRRPTDDRQGSLF
ncbi:hypothetical protein [Trinickia sp.]|uniref:hypothetical protein n=1 Tax=Trinickia sp. TaxID=2571163 RepID=UPI003F7E8B66